MIGALIFTDEVLRRASDVVAREPALANTMSSPEVLAEIRREPSSGECFARACERYRDRTCFTSVLGSITYGRLWDRATRIASALSPGEHVGISGTPGIDWVVADLACLIAGAVSVPLAVNLAPTELRALIEHAELSRIICGASRVAAVAEVFAAELVAMQNDASDARAMPRVPVLTDLEAGAPRGPAPARDTDLVTIMYSSGTTGRPKGVMLGERRWRAHLENALGWPPFPHVWIGYLPHAQIAGRRLVLEMMMHGGVTHFAEGAQPLDDLRRVRPTIVPLLPRVSAILYQQYKSALAAGQQPAEAMAALRAEYATDRLCTIRVGSGSTPPEVIAFLARCFDVPVADGYGTTESGAIAINGVLFDHVDYKLVDLPELGYTAPRGELLVRSPQNTLGYYKDPDATAALFDRDGYLRTGDVVEQLAPRRLVWLDRRANVTKLAQGQFVATSQLEELYATNSAVIDQIFVYANPQHAVLLAVVVPVAGAEDASLRRAIREDLDRIAREAGRPAHEVPRDFVIERAPFTVANELLTESGKQSVRRLRERYATVLDAMLATIEARQLSHAALADTSLDLASRVRAAIAVTLGLTVEDVANAPPELGFVGFGGDSLGALRLSKLVEDALGIELPVASVLDRTASLASIVDGIAKRTTTVAFEDVHPHPIASAQELWRIVPDDVATGRPAHVPPRTLLVTGGTGFVGRMLALALAEHADVICLVRGENALVATARLRAAAGEGGILAELDAMIAGGRIAVVAGDLMRPALGLGAHELAALVERIDAIVHAGALVNHALPYRDLWPPNVLGTRELARVALARPGIAMCFLSSIGVPMQHTRAVDSTEPGAGYVTSKWACEVMLEELHARRGVPVAIVRCGNVAPHRDHPTALNWADNTNRLLHGVIATGLAPASFYAGAGARYDLVPLDAAVRAITKIAMSAERGLATHHVTSDDEVSLDTLVAWVESAGVTLTRLPYPAWFATWRERLEALPPAVRARSAFATVERWREPVHEIARFDTTTYRALRPSVVDEALVHRWVAALRER